MGEKKILGWPDVRAFEDKYVSFSRVDETPGYYFRCPICGAVVDVTGDKLDKRTLDLKLYIATPKILQHLKNEHHIDVLLGKDEEKHYVCLVCGATLYRRMYAYYHLVLEHLDYIKKNVEWIYVLSLATARKLRKLREFIYKKRHPNWKWDIWRPFKSVVIEIRSDLIVIRNTKQWMLTPIIIKKEEDAVLVYEGEAP